MVSVTKMTEEEIEDFDELYHYIRKEIMGYDDEQTLSRYFVLRLKGLAEGKFISNKKEKSYGSYSYKTILYTFKIGKAKIFKAFASVPIKDEGHKINLIMMIIEREINDVVDRVRKVNESNRKMKVKKLPQQNNEQAEYKAKTKRRNKELDDLW